jgi:hypothetical protein
MPSFASRPRVGWLVGALAIAASLLVAGPVAASQTRPLHLTLTHVVFTGDSCPGCTYTTVTDAGSATGNGVGNGTMTGVLYVDGSLGGTCLVIDETSTFSFTTGSVTIQSHQVDCNVTGQRVDTTFVVTGGTGIFAGASGGGREHSSVGKASAFIYDGTVAY